MADILIYAVSSDVHWVGSAPSNVADLLRTASLMVAAATRTAVYATDATGLPTDTDTRDAFKQAAAAQAAFLDANGIVPQAGEAGLAEVSSSIGDASVTFSSAALTGALSTLCSEAMIILSQAGLVQQPPQMVRWL